MISQFLDIQATVTSEQDLIEAGCSFSSKQIMFLSLLD
jgi:hypothetical protein